MPKTVPRSKETVLGDAPASWPTQGLPHPFLRVSKPHGSHRRYILTLPEFPAFSQPSNLHRTAMFIF